MAALAICVAVLPMPLPARLLSSPELGVSIELDLTPPAVGSPDVEATAAAPAVATTAAGTLVGAPAAAAPAEAASTLPDNEVDAHPRLSLITSVAVNSEENVP